MERRAKQEDRLLRQENLDSITVTDYSVDERPTGEGERDEVYEAKGRYHRQNANFCCFSSSSCQPKEPVTSKT